MADGPPAEPPAAAPAGEAAVPAAAPETVRMPENAYRELKEGEEYRPIVSADAQVPEITARSVGFGIANAIFWSAAVAYLTLKLGQGLEAAIPIAILAIGYSAMKKRPPACSRTST